MTFLSESRISLKMGLPICISRMFRCFPSLSRYANVHPLGIKPAFLPPVASPGCGPRCGCGNAAQVTDACVHDEEMCFKQSSILLHRITDLFCAASLIPSLIPSASMSVALMNESINSIKAVDSPTSLEALIAEQYSCWFSQMMDSIGHQAKAGFHLDSRSVCHNRPIRQFPSEKDGSVPIHSGTYGCE